MIYSLTGTLLQKSANDAVIECGGVGYFVLVPSSTAGCLPAIGAKCTLYTYMNVTDNDISLFGFADKDSQAMFKIITTVSGVGPKAGIAILSVLDPQRIVLAISSGDYKAFTAASGVGPKLGQRIVLELKDKIGKSFGTSIDVSAVSNVTAAPVGGMSQAIAALISLGYNQSEAALALSKLDTSLPVEELIRLALQGMARGK